jgi:alpha-tubulin suppressor-like RCC1 family protein
MPFITASPYFKYYYSTGSVGPVVYTGRLFMFGVGNYGQLGDSSRISWYAKSSPTQVGVTTQWDSVVTSYQSRSIYAINSSKLLFSWGTNSVSQLGHGGGNRSSPTQIGSSSWSLVAANDQSGSAIRIDGRLFSWGAGDFGQLGTGNQSIVSSPTQIGTSSWLMVAAGSYSYFGIRDDKTLWAWGYNQIGYLGLTDKSNRSSPVQIGSGSWTTVTAAPGITSALSDTGILYSWGDNKYGQLGDTSTITRSSPVQIGSMVWSNISNDSIKTMGISQGKMYVTGVYPVPDQIFNWKTIAVGPNFALGIRQSDSTLWAWGDNQGGQLGLNDRLPRSVPVQVSTSSWSQVAAGDSFSVGLTSNGRLFTWGDNFYSQLGQNNTIRRSSPTQVGTSSWSQVAAGASAGFAIRSNGSLFAWGGQNFGVLGNFRTFTTAASPVQIGLSSWSSVSAGISNTAAIRRDGKLFIWGSNDSGQLGQTFGPASIVARSSPVQLGTLNWNKVSVGNNQIMAIRSDSKLFAWGNNVNGQLGLTNTSNRSSPVQIGTSNWLSLASGENACYAVTASNVLFGWGQSQRLSANFTGGPLSGSQSSPVQIATGVSDVYTRATNLLNLYSYRYYYRLSLGVIEEMKPLSYGINPIGLTYAFRSSMTQIGTASNWKNVVATGYGAYMQTTGGVWYKWGATPDIMLDNAIPVATPTLLAVSNVTVISGKNSPVYPEYNSAESLFGYIQKS